MKWVAHVFQRQNNGLLKTSTFHTRLNKRLERKLQSVLERVNRRDASNFLKICFKIFYKFQPPVTLTDRPMNFEYFLGENG